MRYDSDAETQIDNLIADAASRGVVVDRDRLYSAIEGGRGEDMAHVVDGPMLCLLCEQDMGEVVRRLRAQVAELQEMNRLERIHAGTIIRERDDCQRALVDMSRANTDAIAAFSDVAAKLNAAQAELHGLRITGQPASPSIDSGAGVDISTTE
jgi:hypothetical protein